MRHLLPILASLTACGGTDATPTTDGDVLADTGTTTDTATTADSGNTADTGGDTAASPAIVAADGSGDYTTLGSALAAQETDILVRAGTYEVSESLVVAVAGTRIRGEQATAVRFVQTSDAHDLLVVRADDVTVSDLTLDTQAHGQAAFVEQSSDRVTLQDCVILGGSNIFTVYFAGPAVAANQETMDAFAAGQVSTGNRMLRNVITSGFRGDSVVFALQRDGEVSGNSLTRGMLSAYLDRNVQITNNTIAYAPTNGIFVSLPSVDVVVSGNRVIDSTYSAIVIKPQLEHVWTGAPLDSTGVVLASNDLTSELSGIEVDGTLGQPERGVLREVTIRDNTVALDDFAGIYLLRTSAPSVTGNTVRFVGSDTSRRGVDGRPAIASSSSTGVFVDLLVDAPTIADNTLIRDAAATDIAVMQNAVVLSAPTVTNATVTGNAFQRYADDWMHAPCATDGGPVDRDGVYDLTGGVHTITGNTCDSDL